MIYSHAFILNLTAHLKKRNGTLKAEDKPVDNYFSIYKRRTYSRFKKFNTNA